ncbi:MAG: hypothetical protein CMM87_05940 [Rickettsiales bacterium]|nr:hypothetical protein [Rickettsiales bacterium]|tara:strand:+ start:12989 stop:13750 length:762 start_codon:yes stop_codon:yes gene_type:complete
MVAFRIAVCLCFLALHSQAKVLSLDVCTDQWILALIKPDHIAALTYLSHNPQFSLAAPKAKQYPIHNDSLEDIQRLNPKYLIVEGFIHPFKKTAYQQKGWQVLVLPPINCAADFQKRLTFLKENLPARYFKTNLPKFDLIPTPQQPQTAVCISSSGQAQGPNTPGDIFLKAQGLKNHITKPGFHPTDPEALLSHPPAMIFIADLGHRQTQYLKKNLRSKKQQHTDIDSRFLLCPTPWHFQALQSKLKQNQADS